MTIESEPISDTPLWIGESDVVASVSLAQAIDAVRQTYLRVASQEVVAMPKTVVAWRGGTLHALGAVDTASQLAVSKTWAHTPGGATPLLVAWNTATGKLIAVIEAFALGQLRTGAICGVATAALAREQCQIVGVIGSGKQAEGQIAAVAAVRKVEQIKIFSPNAAHRTSFAARIADRSGIPAVAVDSVAEAVAQASVVVTATRAREPFVSRQMLVDGVHVNAIGAITPERAELEPAVVTAARRLVADNVAAARELAPREFSPALATHVLSLAYVLAHSVGRPNAEALTVFKAVGCGVSDLAVAELAIAQARASGRGRPFSLAVRSDPRMWSQR